MKKKRPSKERKGPSGEVLVKSRRKIEGDLEVEFYSRSPGRFALYVDVDERPARRLRWAKRFTAPEADLLAAQLARVLGYEVHGYEWPRRTAPVSARRAHRGVRLSVQSLTHPSSVVVTRAVAQKILELLAERLGWDLDD